MKQIPFCLCNTFAEAFHFIGHTRFLSPTILISISHDASEFLQVMDPLVSVVLCFHSRGRLIKPTANRLLVEAL